MAQEQVINKGMLQAFNMMCVQKKQNMIGENGDYFYNIGFTDGTNILLVTAGKFCDNVEPFHKYNLGFDWVDKKLKLVYKEEIK